MLLSLVFSILLLPTVSSKNVAPQKVGRDCAEKVTIFVKTAWPKTINEYTPEECMDKYKKCRDMVECDGEQSVDFVCDIQLFQTGPFKNCSSLHNNLYKIIASAMDLKGSDCDFDDSQFESAKRTVKELCSQEAVEDMEKKKTRLRFKLCDMHQANYKKSNNLKDRKEKKLLNRFD